MINPSASGASPLIHVARHGVIMGKYQRADVIALIASGQVLRTDHYWSRGLPGWQLIGATFDDVSGPSSAGVPGSVAQPPVQPARRPAGLPPTIPPSLQARNSSSGLPKAFYLTPVFLVLALIGLIILIQGYAYVTLKAPLARALRSDSRNIGIEATTYYRYNLPGGSIVLNIDDVGSDTKNADIMRVLLQFAKTQQDTEHDWVILACRGTERFKIRGSHFRTMGVEYGSQNPMYTMRTLPENIYRLNGTRAYPVWEGGALGVMAEQMKNFSEFTTEWLR